MSSTEQASRSSTLGSAPSLLETLARANDFSLEDLELNRQGQFSTRQKKRLLKRCLLFSALFIGSLLIVVWPLKGGIWQLRVESVLFYLLIFVVFLFGFGWTAIMILIDLWNNKVTSVQGPVVRLRERTRRGTSYFYITGSQRFRVSPLAYECLVDGMYYRIHYAPYSQELVSIEPIRSGRRRHT